MNKKKEETVVHILTYTSIFDQFILKKKISQQNLQLLPATKIIS